jgi:hypothetical protein
LVAIHPFAKKMDHQNSGVPEFWHFTWAQIGTIRFAVVKPAGDGPVSSSSLEQALDRGTERPATEPPLTVAADGRSFV